MKSLLLPLLLLSFTTVAQLSGSYTVGAAGDDFESVDDAISALQNQGFGGPVEFAISDGFYGRLDLVNIGATASHPLTVRSASGNPYGVVFYSSLIKDSEHLTLSGLSFRRHEEDDNENAVVTLANAGCRFSQCRIVDSFFVAANRYEPALRINNVTNTSVKHQWIDTCFIYCQDGVEYGNWGSITIEQRGNNASSQYYTGDTVWGALNFWHNSFHREFKGCHFYESGGLEESGTALIDSCYISFGIGSETTKADQILNSKFEGQTVSFYGYQMLNCEVTAIDIFAGVSDTEDCIFYGSCSMSSGVVFKYFRNEFHGQASTGDGPGEISNNFFFGNVRTGVMLGTKLYGNNFGPDAMFEIWGIVKCINNNFSNVWIRPGLEAYVELSHNNYNYTFYTASEFYSSYDDAPTYYDPQYTSETDLHINNPALFSNARYLNALQTAVDIDLENRGQIRSRGADEACVSLPLRDTVYLDCGSLFEFKSCDDGYSWQSTIAFSDTIEGAPTARVDTIVTAWLFDQNGVMIDSMVLIPSVRPLTKRNLYLPCGLTYPIATLSTDGADIYWNPAELVDDPNAHIVSMNLDTTTLFVVEQDLGSCGIRYDSIMVNVYQSIGIEFIATDVNCNTIAFDGHAYCYDSLRWSFGDGSFNTTDLDVTHSYAEAGGHEAYLTVWFTDTTMVWGGEVMTSCAVLEEYNSASFELYPNPALDHITIAASENVGEGFSIMSANGVVVLEGKLNAFTEVEVNHLSPGMYFVKVGSVTKSFVRIE